MPVLLFGFAQPVRVVRTCRIVPNSVGRDDGIGRPLVNGIRKRQGQPAFGGVNALFLDISHALVVARKPTPHFVSIGPVGPFSINSITSARSGLESSSKALEVPYRYRHRRRRRKNSRRVRCSPRSARVAPLSAEATARKRTHSIRCSPCSRQYSSHSSLNPVYPQLTLTLRVLCFCGNVKPLPYKLIRLRCVPLAEFQLNTCERLAFRRQRVHVAGDAASQSVGLPIPPGLACGSLLPV